MTNSYKTMVKDKLVTFTFLGKDILPPFDMVTSVAVIPFNNEGELVVVDLFHRGLDLPGGHVEPGETSPEQTMRREVMEEASMTLREPTFVEAIKSDYFEDRSSYMLLYTAFVDELLDFNVNNESRSRVVIDRDEFIDKYIAGDKELMRNTIEEAWKLLSESSKLVH